MAQPAVGLNAANSNAGQVVTATFITNSPRMPGTQQHSQAGLIPLSRKAAHDALHGGGGPFAEAPISLTGEMGQYSNEHGNQQSSQDSEVAL